MTRVAAITAPMENGMLGRHRAPSSMTAATARARTTAVQFGALANSPMARQATTSTLSPSGLATPSAFGTCWRPMTQAMPRVKPSTTGAGTYRMYRPALSSARAINRTPAIRPTVSTPPAPYWATIGTNTTVIAPVGPEI